MVYSFSTSLERKRSFCTYLHLKCIVISLDDKFWLQMFCEASWLHKWTRLILLRKDNVLLFIKVQLLCFIFGQLFYVKKPCQNMSRNMDQTRFFSFVFTWIYLWLRLSSVELALGIFYFFYKCYEKISLLYHFYVFTSMML